MRYQLPQFIDVEDRIIGPLTAKQFGWLFGGVLLWLPFYFMADPSLMILSGFLIIGTAAVFAVYRPYGRSFYSYLISVIKYFFQPKLFLWRKEKKSKKKKGDKELKKRAKSPDFADMKITDKQGVTDKRLEILAKKLDQSK